MNRFCANCGTEVKDTAVFCPTCGQPIDQATETEIPPAPAWPDDASDQPSARERDDDSSAADAQPRFEEPTRLEETLPPPPPPAPPGSVPPPTPGRPSPRPVKDRPAAPVRVPFTMPLTLSAWLIGGGTALAALGIVIGLFGGFLNPVDLILVLALAAVAATIFLSATVPDFAHLRLATLVIVLIGFGIALDRIGFGAAGIGDLLLLLGTAAAGIGAIILELGRDQPLGGLQR